MKLVSLIAQSNTRIHCKLISVLSLALKGAVVYGFRRTRSQVCLIIEQVLHRSEWTDFIAAKSYDTLLQNTCTHSHVNNLTSSTPVFLRLLWMAAVSDLSQQVGMRP